MFFFGPVNKNNKSINSGFCFFFSRSGLVRCFGAKKETVWEPKPLFLQSVSSKLVLFSLCPLPTAGITLGGLLPLGNQKHGFSFGKQQFSRNHLFAKNLVFVPIFIIILAPFSCIVGIIFRYYFGIDFRVTFLPNFFNV